VNKTTASAAQLEKCVLLHTYSRTTAAPITNKNIIAYLTSWHNNILGYKLRTD